MTTLQTILATCHLALLAPLCVLGLHKAWTIVLFRRGRRSVRRPSAGPDAGSVSAPDAARNQEPWDEMPPRVTVQLPVYNERFVVARLIEAVAAIDYPRDRLQVQVLDDSTDHTSALVEEAIACLPRDVEIQHVRRADRSGYKAGALAHGLRSATGELIAVFDADFVPPADFLRRAVPRFSDEKVGLVQARWGHTNREAGTLTEVQALLLDGHFAIEQCARATNGCFFNFNGTAGVFRRTCIEDAGGWQDDTLTEDMDLSYRAQLRGWRFVYLPDLCCPADLPTDMGGFLTQQHRWAKGSIQTGRKLIGRILRAPLPALTKVESAFHLFGNVAFPILLALILVAMPLQLVRYLQDTPVDPLLAWLEGMPLILSTLSVLTYFGASQLQLGRFGPATVRALPLILALGAGVCLNNTLAVCGALRRHSGEFRRTPKFRANDAARREAGYHSPRGVLPLFEILLGGWATTTFALAAVQGQIGAAAFHGLFAAGLLWVGLRSLLGNRRYRALVPAALLASCTGSGGGHAPIIAADADPEIVACRATIGDEFARTEIVYSTRRGLGLNDLPSRTGMEFGVRVHPDGNRLVFARERAKNRESSREIHVAGLDNSPFDTRLTANTSIDDSPCWAPDGKSILFSSDRAGDRDLWKMDTDGKNATQVTSGAPADRDPDWHAAGVVFSRADPPAATARLFLTDVNGNNPVAITDGGTGPGDFEPAWAPDGKSVLFVRDVAAGRQVLMLQVLGQPAPTPLGDGQGEDRYPRWSPQGDRIFVARNRPAQGVQGLRLFAMHADGSDPVMIHPERSYAYLGFDPLPNLPAYPQLEPADTLADVGSGSLSMQLGVASRGLSRNVLDKDGVVFGVRTERFNGREVAGILLTLNLPVADVDRIASLTVEVTGALSRTDADSFFRLALRNFARQRYDSAVEVSPLDDRLHTWTFRTASLNHVDRGGQIRLEVIGDMSGGDPADLLIDHIGVSVRLHAAK